MKKIALISAIALSGLLYNSANAQIRVHLGFNFGPRPVYVPARVVVQDQPVVYAQPANYDGDEDYYYLPEVDAYYSIPEQCYYYNNGGRWISAAYLPGAYRDFDWRYARRYEVRAPRPFMHNDYYRTRYNGVAFNGNWNRGYNRGYANAGRFNNDQFRRDDRRFDNNRAWGGDNRRFDQNRGQRFDDNRNNGRNDQRNQRTQNFDRNGAQERFVSNNAQRNDRGDRDNHRPGRF